MTIKDDILALQTGERYLIPESSYTDPKSEVEIWHINGQYFLFCLSGGRMKLAEYYEDIDMLMEKIESWN